MKRKILLVDFDRRIFGSRQQLVQAWVQDYTVYRRDFPKISNYATTGWQNDDHI